MRADGASASRGLLDWLTAMSTAATHTHGSRGRSVEYIVGFAITESVRDAITVVPKNAWTAAIDSDGDVRDHADVVEITRLLPDSLREAGRPECGVIVRREHPHPGAQLSLFERDGVALPSARHQRRHRRHRVPRRPPPRPRPRRRPDPNRQDTGLSRFPSRKYAINHAGLTVVQVTADLLARLRLLALPDALKACEPKALRYRFLHIPARVTRGVRGVTSGFHRRAVGY